MRKEVGETRALLHLSRTVCALNMWPHFRLLVWRMWYRDDFIVSGVGVRVGNWWWMFHRNWETPWRAGWSRHKWQGASRTPRTIR